jgi:hypothetical protein
MLHRDYVGAVEGADEADTGGDGFVDEHVAAQPSHQHRAGAAIALGTSLLRADQPAVEAEEIEQGAGCGDVGEDDVLAVEDEAQL